MSKDWRLLEGDCRAQMDRVDAESVQCVVTSPPYWKQRDFELGDDQLGNEDNLDDYIEDLVDIGRQVRRVLRPDGTWWLNLGDGYTGRPGNGRGSVGSEYFKNPVNRAGVKRVAGLPEKSLIGVPWRVALALQADGWLLRCDVIWHKPNAQPQSVLDRPTTDHEYVFLLTRGPEYYYGYEDAKEAALTDDFRRPHMSHGARKLDGRLDRGGGDRRNGENDGKRNRRTVWSISVASRRDAHFATFPPKLARTCVLAGARRGDLVLDPFSGRGTVGEVCMELGRRFVGIDANPKYIKMARRNILVARERAGTLTAAEAVLAKEAAIEVAQLGLLED